MGSALILHPDELTADVNNIGGKARGLLHIHRAGLPTPPWRVLPFDTVAARPWHEDATFRSTLNTLLKDFDGHIAARSSAALEDGTQTSHAGQFHTAFADSLEDLFAALDAVANSARDQPIAIVLQQALAPTLAGVAFSADPACARPDMLYLEAVEGHGKHLVDGDATPMRNHIDLNGNISSDPSDVSDTPDLSKASLARFTAPIANAILTLESHFDSAVDIEWAIADETLYILQARPLTALHLAPALLPPSCHTSWFFDQRFLRPITPFTRSTLVPLILRASLGSALEMRGQDPRNVVAVFHGGQAYVPHAAYRAMLSGAPRWWLSPDLRQLYPRACACAGSPPRDNIVAYAWHALRAVLVHHREVFLNIRAWDEFRDALPARIDAACALPTLAEQWRALDALSTAFLAIHRWSILWADYFFRAYNIATAILGPDRARHWLLAGMHLATAMANQARKSGHATASGYGDRSGSLDYAEPTWRELFPDHAAAPPATPLSPAPRWNLLRRFLEMREEQRLHWEHVLARQRALALAHAATLPLAQPNDVWLLTWEEFLGEVPPAEALAARRHALHIDALVRKPLFLGPRHPGAALPDAGALQGVGASAGQASGTLIHLRNPAAGLPTPPPRPCILVVPALDPAHTALMHQVDGIVAERGGLLSHAAILAREYGLPMVTALEHAFEHLPAGTQATIDGQTGEIRLEDPGALL